MDGNSKQLLSERIKNATNILVTVSRNPSVDDLSAALGLTLMLNKMDKHATAVFSGAVPPAISFLQPEKTFEGTVDSLRDFIIALDKEKADRLRYKVEDDVVRIFITPYRTTITQNDLQFSQGDFNVELIIALGVDKKEDLDAAISAHGRILHDATVATVNANNQQSDLGSIDWSDGSASSLCEMLMSLSESLKSGILDQQISTALLTGIVAATDRFSNTHTSPKVMTMAAQLMAAGANQQLIATKLEEGHELIKPGQQKNGDGSTPMTEGTSQKVAPDDAKGEMHIDHEANQLPAVEPPQTTKDEETLANELHRVAPAAPNLSVGDLQKDLAAANQELDQASESTLKAKGSDWRDKNSTHEPSFGGTLNATTDAAAEEKMREDRSRRNHVLLSHDSPAVDSGLTSPLNATMANGREPANVDPFAVAPRHDSDDSMMSYEQTPFTPPSAQQHDDTPPPPPMPEPPKPEPTPAPEPPAPVEPPEPVDLPEPPADSPTLGTVSDEPHSPNLLDLENRVHESPIVDENSTLSDARAAVDAALNNAPYKPERLESSGATPFPEIHHDEPQQADANMTPPPMPPLPDFSTLPPLPGEEPHDQPPVGSSDASTPPPMPPQPVTPPPANDPAQFKLPGQP